jgi:ABC-type transporter Mla MlaB component
MWAGAESSASLAAWPTAGPTPAAAAPTPGVGCAVRPGEHACCRYTDACDAERVVTGFIYDGLQRGHKVMCLSADPPMRALPAALDGVRGPALASGQVEIRSANEVYPPDGGFDVDRVLAFWADALARALGEGYRGLSATGDMSWAAGGDHGWEHVAEYERRLAHVGEDGTLRILCRYEQARFATGALWEISAAHDVEISPELAPIGRDADLACARVLRTGRLRVAGELDYDCADTLADVLHSRLGGDLRVDLADLRFVDVVGMRALRTQAAQRLSIAGASEPVRRLLALMGWDTDPQIEVLATA